MPKRLHLALAIHNHQPVGNFDSVFERAYRTAYLPMVEALQRHPSVRLALHYSGPLLDWLRAQHPELLASVRSLTARRQVEIMTGGYYEPILVSLPEADQRGQIRKMTRTVHDEFGVHAAGLWLAERVWEPHLPRVLSQEGIRYTIVDDTHFKWVGMADDDLFGHYVTEEQGEALSILATSKHLRYSVPWASVDDVIGWLRDQATEDGGRVAVMGDDGEKFGMWPGTFEHCWTDGWVERFFRAIEENSDWLETIPPGEVVATLPALGSVHLPAASYDEMSEWALPGRLAGDLAALKHRLQEEQRDDLLQFIRGGFWRSFLDKYPEVNAMHKKMLRVSARVHAIEDAGVRERALDELWAGQCNCPYWHGVFGGIYLPHIRTANWSHLLAAESLADDDAHRDRGWVEVGEEDYYRDGRSELLVSTAAMNVMLSPRSGGTMLEWDWRDKRLNLLNTLSRREEGYHRLLRGASTAPPANPEEAPNEGAATVRTIHEIVRAKEPGLDKLLHIDRYRRAGLIDHFFSMGTPLDVFAPACGGEAGDFVDGAYSCAVQSSGQATLVTLARDGQVRVGEHSVSTRVVKELTIEADRTELPIRYSVTNTDSVRLEAAFGVEFNLALLSGHSDDAYYRIDGVRPDAEHLDSTGETCPVSRIELVSEWLMLSVRLELARPARLWRLPLETVSNSEEGFERVYQASCILPQWDLALAPGETWSVEMRFRLDDLSGG